MEAPTTLTAQAGSSPGGPAPLLSSFPAGVNPETYQLESVTQLLDRFAVFSIFSIHDPSRPNVPIPSPRDPSRLIGIQVKEQLHRFVLEAEQASSGDLCPINRTGEPFATVQIHWMLTPDDFVAAPGRVPPPTELDLSRSQRFTMLDGRFSVQDRPSSGFRGFGAGRTFPVMVGGRPQLRIGAVINVLEGFGRFAGHAGTVVVNGYIEPPTEIFLNFILRLPDPAGQLKARSPLRPIRSMPASDPGTTFLALQGELDPDNPVTLNYSSDGRVLGSNLHERLRLVRLDFDADTPEGIRYCRSVGPIVGRLDTTTRFDPFSREFPIPLRTQGGVLTLTDQRGRTMGTLQADIVEGRVFPTSVPGAPAPLFRIGGFGPFLGGTGPFRELIGMLSMNSVISLFPRTLSMLYVLRISDPDGRFRAACRDAWS
jgi:hypothetical protein